MFRYVMSWQVRLDSLGLVVTSYVLADLFGLVVSSFVRVCCVRFCFHCNLEGKGVKMEEEMKERLLYGYKNICETVHKICKQEVDNPLANQIIGILETPALYFPWIFLRLKLHPKR